MNTATMMWALGVVVLLGLLWALFQSMRLRGVGSWLVFIFWGGLSVWAVMMFLSGKVHL